MKHHLSPAFFVRASAVLGVMCVCFSAHADFSISYGAGAGKSTAPAAVVGRDLPALGQPASAVAAVQSTANAPETAVMAPAIDTWLVTPTDKTLRSVLAKWSSKAGWQLSWEASVDLPLTVSASFDGDFKSAVKNLFAALSASEVNLSGLLYSGNRVLRVTEVGVRTE